MIFEPPTFEVLDLVWLLAGRQYLENLVAERVAEQPEAIAFHPEIEKRAADAMPSLAKIVCVRSAQKWPRGWERDRCGHLLAEQIALIEHSWVAEEVGRNFFQEPGLNPWVGNPLALGGGGSG